MNLVSQTFETQSLAAYYEKDAEALMSINQGLEAAIEAGKKLKKSQGEMRHYHALHIWNMWRLGRVLEELAPHGGPRLAGANLETTLATLGISPELSAKSRIVAAVHQEDLRTFLDESGDEINLSHLLKLHTESTTEPPVWNDDAEWRMVISVLRDYLEHSTDEYRMSIISDVIDRLSS